MTRMARGAAVLFATVALAAGVLVSGAKAAPSPCSAKQCADEVAAGCPGLSGKDLDNCKTSVLNQCKLGVCSCTGDPTLPACGPTTTTTTTTTNPGGIQCCLRTVSCGPFEICQVVMTSEE